MLKNPYFTVSIKNYFKYKDTDNLKVKGQENTCDEKIKKNLNGYMNIQQSRLKNKEYYQE